LIGGLIGDAIGTPTEGMSYADIESKFGWVDDFDCDGTDDTIMKNLLAEALISTDGFASYDDWAQTWLDNWDAIFGDKVGKFFISVLHTAVKLHEHSTPRMAALGNMPSSSSAMCIAPVGIVNACNPRQAAEQAYNLASLIHIHDVSFCQDGAAAIAAAVAAAFLPSATVDSILNAALNALIPVSGKEMVDLISNVLETANQASDYKAFRRTVYDDGQFFRRILCDSRETIPLTLALLRLADGDVEKMVTYAANFGRDTDTIGTMGGAIAGAYQGINEIRTDWVEKVQQVTDIDQDKMAEQLILTSRAKFDSQQAARQDYLAMWG
jgi:ADP-ribosylglycohydrolase